MLLCGGGTDHTIWAGVRSGQSHCRVWVFLGWQLPCPAFVQAVACGQSLPLSPPKSHASLRLPCSLSPALPPTVAAAGLGCWAAPAAATAAARPEFRGRLEGCCKRCQICKTGCGTGAAGWDGEALSGVEVQDPWDAERVAAAKPAAARSARPRRVAGQAVIFGWARVMRRGRAWKALGPSCSLPCVPAVMGSGLPG